MTRFELLVEINGQRKWLDTYDVEPINLTYNVSDIMEIDKRNSSYSKTIKIPETRNNREIFGDISDLGVEATFNPNKKTKAYILVDTVLIFEGYLQLRKVYVDKDENKAEYEVVIYADNDNFFKLIGENFLTDLDFSELNHAWNATNIRQSWTASWDKGYYYPLIDYGYNWELGSINGWTTTYNTEVKTTQMFPATNVRYIWDKIFDNVGYTYQSTFLDSEIFKSLYIPFNRQELKRDVNSLADKFTIGMLAPATFSNSTQLTIQPDLVEEYDSWAGTYLYTPTQRYINFGKFRLPFNNENSPNGDPDGLYNTSTYEYVADSDFVAGSFVCDFDITFRFSGVEANWYIENTTLPLSSICFRRSKNPATGQDVAGGVVIPVNGNQFPLRFTTAQIPGIQYDLVVPQNTPGFTNASNGFIFAINQHAGPRRVSGQIATPILDGSTTDRKKLYPGEKVWVEVNYGISNWQIRTQFGNQNLLGPAITMGLNGTYNTTLPSGIILGTFSSSNRFFNVLSQNVLGNETIDYSQTLPTNFKQKDFLTSIIKMFNLIVEPSKENEKTLIIEPRDEYYAKGRIKDWTSKLDINQPIEEQILAETQNRQTNFRYKDDKDIYNEDYKNNRGGLSYGEYQYFIDNDFITGQKKVELNFSPTPLIPVLGSTKLVIPKIGKSDNNVFSKTEHNPRILTRFNSSTNKTWVYSDYQFHSSSGPFNAYIKLTTNGFTNLAHPNYQVGDWININQADGGALKPMLQGQFKIVEIVDTKTIVINIPFSDVGSGAPVAGTITPLDGLLPVEADTDTWQFEGVRYKAYPYLGHFDNPFDPNYDINFGQTTGLYYPEESVTNNNLFSSYWENMMIEISDKDSRIITASFYLTPFDIADFRFNDNIYINGQYYKVNKIMNYDPTKEALVKIELIKTLIITVPRPFVRNFISEKPRDVVSVVSVGNGKPFTTTGFVGAGKDIVLNRPLGRPGILTGGVKTNSTNLVEKSDVIVSGRDNEVYGSNVIVSGDTNIVSSDKNFVQGDGNRIPLGAENNFVMGSNNTFASDVKNSFVIGSNQEITSSNTFYVNTTIVQGADEVSASRNEVLNPFSVKIINYISASRNAIRELGSYDNTSELSGGRYKLS